MEWSPRQGETDVFALEAPGDEVLDGLAAKLLAEENDERFLGEDGLAEVGFAGAEEGGEVFVAIGGQVLHGFGLAVELDGSGVGDVEAGAVEAHVGAEQPGEERVLLRGIAADEKDGGSGGNVAQAGGFAWAAPGRGPVRAGKGAGKGCVVGGARVVDVVGLQERCARISAADSFLRWWCGWSR